MATDPNGNVILANDSILGSQPNSFHLNYSKEQIRETSTPNPIAPEEKLMGSLKEEKSSSSPQLVNVNIISNSPDLASLAIRLGQDQIILKQRFDAARILSLQVPENKLLQLAQDSDVKSIWPDRIFHASLDTSVAQINAPSMWNAGYTGTGIKVAVLDTGINGSHPMLQGKVIYSADCTSSSCQTGAAVDNLGHGTAVAGIIAGSQNGANTYNGVAPDSRLFNIKVLDDTGHGAESWIIAGINRALDPDQNAQTNDGAQVINLSLGGPYSEPNSPVVAAIESAISSGVTVIVAAGNCGPTCPSSECQGFVGIETPGDAPDAITVGAVDDASQYACFSSGDTINGQIKPDVVAPGVNITSSGLNSSLSTQSGTSFSSPHVAGLAALLIQSQPSISPATIKDVLQQTAVDLGPAGKDIQYGSGLVNGASLAPSTVYALLRYTLSISSPTIYQNTPESITFNSISNDVASIAIAVTHPNQSVENIALSQNALQWTGSITDTNELGSYLVQATVIGVDGNQTSLTKTFVVQGPSTTGVIISQNLPAQVSYGSLQQVDVQFQNTGATPTQVLVELQEWKEDYFERIQFSNPSNVGAGQTVTMSIPWVPQSSLGNKTIKLVATFDDKELEQDQNVWVVDSNIPQLDAVTFSPTTTQANPLLVSIQAEDLTPLHGTLHVSSPVAQKDFNLMRTSIGDGNQLLQGLIEPDANGNYSFTAQLCDAYGNCMTTSTQSFAVTSCTLPRALIFNSDNNFSTFNFLNSSYCLGHWGLLSQMPTVPFLQSFPLIYWDAGTSYSDAIDANASQRLLTYAGNAVLEGDDIASRHGDDSLLQEWGHSRLKSPLSFDTNHSIPLVQARSHRIFDGLTFPLSFAYGANRSTPDALEPTIGSVTLGSWDVNGAAIVAYQNGAVRRLMLPFSTHRLSTQDRQQFLSNIFNWMYSNTGPDGVVSQLSGIPDDNAPLNDHNQLNGLSDPASFTGNYLSALPSDSNLFVYVHPHYFVSGMNTFPIRIRNDSNASITGMPLQVWVDANLNQTLNINVTPNTSVDFNATVYLATGTHVIKAILNPSTSASFNEFNTLNNITTVTVWVAPTLPNLHMIGIYPHNNPNTMDAEVEYANFGGSAANPSSFTLSFAGNNFTATTPTLAPGSIVRQVIATNLPRQNATITATIDANHAITEANENDNTLTTRTYFCTKEKVLIVNDNDAEPYVSTNPSSAGAFEYNLDEAGYCVQRWDENTAGTPTLNALSSADLVIWSAGDYWNRVLDSNDLAVLEQYNGNVWLEGNDIGFDHADDNAFISYMQADFNKDIFLPTASARLTLGIPRIYDDLPYIDINTTVSSFPDGFIPAGVSFCFADWNAGASAICSTQNGYLRKMVTGFSIDDISNPVQRFLFINDTARALLAGGNQPPSTPTNFLCNNATCANHHYTGTTSFQCTGAVDPENDPVFYSLEAGIPTTFNAGFGYSDWWDQNWNYRTPLFIQNDSNSIALGTGSILPLSIDFRPLVINGVLQPNLQDFRVVYQNHDANAVILPSSAGQFSQSERASSSNSFTNIGTNDFTLESWFKTSASGFHQHITGKRNAAASSWIREFIYATNGHAFCETGQTDLESTTAVNDGQWHHLACERSNGVFKMYLDGNLITSNTLTANLDNSAPFEIGSLSDYPSNAFSGSIDEVRYSNIARYTANFTPSVSPFANDGSTLGLWHLDNDLNDDSLGAWHLNETGTIAFSAGKIRMNAHGANTVLFPLLGSLSPGQSNGADYAIYVGNPAALPPTTISPLSTPVSTPLIMTLGPAQTVNDPIVSTSTTWVPFAVQSAGQPFTIDVSPIGPLTGIDLRCRAFDTSASLAVSDYFIVDANMSLN